MSNLLLFPAPEDPRQRAQPPDAAARAEALDLRRSFIVQAPAGSGKTALLIQRLLKLLADDSVTEPEQVLAITFTNAATAELRDRVLRALAAAKPVQAEMQAGVVSSLAASGSSDSGEFDPLTFDLAAQVLARDAALGWQLPAHPHRLNIRTIDSVCAEIARTLPVLSGSGGGLTPTEDATPLYREAARRTLLELGGGNVALDSALRSLMLHRDGNLADCETLLADMLALRDQWGELIPLEERELTDDWLDAHLLPRLERTLDLAISATLERLDATMPADVLGDLAALGGHLGQLPGYAGDRSPIACCAGLHDAPEAVAAHLDRWRALIHLVVTAKCEWRKRIAANDLKFEFDKNHPGRSRLQGILARLQGRDDILGLFAEVRDLPDANYPANQWAVAKSLFRALNRALVELQFAFAARGECDFTELSLLARSALRTSSGANDLAAALGARLQHLLVDEMQDTSTGQYDLLERLTASWDGHSQTVFLVGDPYQSIYLFRQARVERFIEAIDSGRLGELPLTALALTANFRSQRTLVEHFNHDFGLIFPRPAGDAGGLHLIRAEATQASSSTEARVWHANPQPAPSATATPRLGVTQARRDAESIARIAGEWLRRPLPAGREAPWRVAVLVRSRNHLAEVIPALRRNALPFRAVDIETLRDRQEVLDLTALTRALLHPADRVAALAVLRAPWCGLPLADLHTLTGGDDWSLRQLSLPRLIEDRGHLLPADSQQRVARVHTVLMAAAQARSRIATAQLVERAWRSLGGDAPLTSAELTNTRRFFELLDALEAAGRIDPTRLEDRLAMLYAEPAALPPDTAFVELLTIHKAKGLEWDVVFVPSLERRPAFGGSRLLTWSVLDEAEAGEGDAANILLAPIAARGEDVDSLTRWLKRRHREREYAENKRVFYVACTRARHELHLFAAPTLSSSGIVSPAWPDSLLKAAWPAAAMSFTQASPIRLATSDPVPCMDDASEPEALALAAGAAPDGESSDVPEGEDTGVPGLYEQATDERLIAPAYSTISRLPAEFDPAARFDSAPLPAGGPAEAFDRKAFARPEGSFAARSFGNAVHQFIDRITARMAGGATPASALAELPSWSSRIEALLRADGLPAATVSRLVRETHTALENLLSDRDGQWLLAPHSGGASEYALTASDAAAWSAGSDPIHPVSVRIDRMFRAGPEPHAPGSSNLWIVDYKTASHSTADIDEFFATQRAAYAPQLEAYARVLAPAQPVALENIRLALYFPALRNAHRLIWWRMEENAPAEDADLLALGATGN